MQTRKWVAEVVAKNHADSERRCETFQKIDQISSRLTQLTLAPNDVYEQPCECPRAWPAGVVMRKRKRKPKSLYEELVEDADTALRSLSRRFPEGLALAVLRPGEQIESAEWLETQVAVRRQLRMDRVLRVRLVGGRQRLVHGEWTDRLNRQVQRRMAEYHLSVAVAERIDTEVAGKLHQGKRKRRRLESMVVVLRGKQEHWPEQGAYRTTPNDSRFGGAWFYIEPVYQRTVAELEAKGSVFWLAFVPVAIDVDEDKLRRTVERLKNEVDDEDFDELVATMMSMTRLRKDSQHFISVIESAAAKEKPMHPFMRLGLERGLEQGLEKGLKKGHEKGLEQGLEKGLSPLLHLFERRLGRHMTDGERRRIAKRVKKDGPNLIGDVVLDLTPEQLATWLAPRKTAKRVG